LLFQKLIHRKELQIGIIELMTYHRWSKNHELFLKKDRIIMNIIGVYLHWLKKCRWGDKHLCNPAIKLITENSKMYSFIIVLKMWNWLQD